jgi:hypothetical protein
MSAIRLIRCCDCAATMEEADDEPVFSCAECGRDDCLMDTGAIVERLTWRGIAIEVRFHAEWLTGFIAHLDITAVSPERAPLPFTETGYRSHFLDIGEVEAAGGAAAFVAAWLDEEAKCESWRDHETATQQLSLF